MTQWEYKHLVAAASGFEKRMGEILAEYGKDGWELVFIWNGYFIFKRPKIETPVVMPEPGTRFANGKIKDFQVNVNNVTTKSA